VTWLTRVDQTCAAPDLDSVLTMTAAVVTVKENRTAGASTIHEEDDDDDDL